MFRVSYDLYKELKSEASSEMQEGNVSCLKFVPLPSTVGKCRLAFMGRSSNPMAAPDPNLMFIDVDPLLRNVDLTNWSDLIKPLRIDDRKKQVYIENCDKIHISNSEAFNTTCSLNANAKARQRESTTSALLATDFSFTEAKLPFFTLTLAKSRNLLLTKFLRLMISHAWIQNFAQAM